MRRCPLPAVTLGEALATSDVPGGVINLLTGQRAELVPWFAGHRDLNALDLTGVDDPEVAAEAERSAADSVMRVTRAIRRRRRLAFCFGRVALRHRGLPRAQDRLAPQGRLTDRSGYCPVSSTTQGSTQKRHIVARSAGRSRMVSSSA